MDYSKQPELMDAIAALRPTSTFSMRDQDYSTIEWSDTENTQPSLEEVNIKLAELQALWDAKMYQHNRAAEYPSIEDQLDDIFHNGIDGWKATIQAIKDKYPKE
jgi:predicted lipoprotein